MVPHNAPIYVSKPLLGTIPCLLGLLLAGQQARAQGSPDPETWLKPPALRPGDTIMFVAPAGPPDRERVLGYARQLEQNGVRVVIPPGLFRRDRYLAGSDDERAAELNAGLRDPRVRAIFPCRGGYGLTRILDRLDYRALRRDPRIITGYSDLTALHLAVARQARVITFHSPMPESSLCRADGVHAFAAQSFWRTLLADGYERGRTGYTIDLPTGGPRPVRLVGGKARGRLVGGNLSLVCATLGTPYGLEARGKILLLEDTGEAPYRVDRMLSQLRLAGILDAVAGVVLGDFSKTDHPAVDQVLRDYFGRLRVPVLMNFPVGHLTANVTLPHGALVELDADGSAFRVLEDPVAISGP
jgi:muramoyltetrapeptide carboxypeptidase